MKDIWKLIKLPFQGIWQVLMWLSMAYWIMLGIVFLIMGVMYLWLEISPPKGETVQLSIVKNNTNKKETFRALEFLNHSLNQSISILEEHESVFNTIGNDINLSNTQKELIELDENKTTYEMVVFEGDLNASVESFHNVWIVQYEEDNVSTMRLLMHDSNTTFPITIRIKNSSNWADIETRHYGDILKKWRFENGKYEIQKSKNKRIYSHS